MSKFHKLTVSNIKQEAIGAISIEFIIPDSLKSDFTFQAGQYVTLISKVNNEELRRDYSICVPEQSGKLKVVVKKVQNGLFSTYANTQLKKGDILRVSKPQGRFVLDSTQYNKPIMLFAAGSGITPIMSILTTFLNQKNNQKCFLVYGNKSKDHAIFFESIKALQNKFPNRFEIIFVFSEKPEQNTHLGRIDPSLVKNALNKFSFQDTQYFVCGPNALMDTIIETLHAKQIPSQQIKRENFVAIKNDPTNLETKDHKIHISIQLDDEILTTDSNSNEFILDALLKRKIDAPYSCQGGICASCICRLTKGEVEMHNNQVLTDDEIEEGLILACQSKPKSSEIAIDFDDI